MKILLVAPYENILGYFRDWTENAITSLNLGSRMFDFRKRRYPRLLRLFLQSKSVESFNEKKMNKELMEEVRVYKPDVVLVYCGEGITGDTLRHIKDQHGAITANWFHDTILSPYRVDFLKEYPKYYDHFFIIDSMRATEKVKIDCRNVHSLGLACDDSVHKKLVLTEKDLVRYGSDLIFIGTVVKNRVPALECIADLGLSIWGPKYNVEGNWLVKNARLEEYYRGGPILNYNEIVKAMNAAKIVVNIHGLSGEEHYDLPSRIFEAAGCGAFQIAEYSNVMEEYFKIGKEIICFSSKEELRDLVKYYLSHDSEREKIARCAQARAYKDHTYIKRVRKLVEILSERQDR